MNENVNTNWVVIREDSLRTTREIGKMLTVEDIPHLVNLAPGCSSGSCALSYTLSVPEGCEERESNRMQASKFFNLLSIDFRTINSSLK